MSLPFPLALNGVPLPPFLPGGSAARDSESLDDLPPFPRDDLPPFPLDFFLLSPFPFSPDSSPNSSFSALRCCCFSNRALSFSLILTFRVSANGWGATRDESRSKRKRRRHTAALCKQRTLFYTPKRVSAFHQTHDVAQLQQDAPKHQRHDGQV